MPPDVLAWWMFLGVVSLGNMLAWCVTAWLLERRRATLPSPTYAARRLQLLLSAGYVLGCAFRSAYPVIDVPRQCLQDSALSTVLVGRSVATLAELCFAAQRALLLGELARAVHSPAGQRAARMVLPLILVAEVCSWYAVLTASNLGHVFEESLWALTAALLIASLAALWPRCEPRLRPMLATGCAVGAVYVAFMLSVDLPMYVARWLADEARGHVPPGLVEGLQRLAGRCTVSHQWAHWRDEVPWMSMYFSVAVWLSIAFVHAPTLQRRADTDTDTGAVRTPRGLRPGGSRATRRP